VIVLKQDLAKTRRLIKSLSAADIDMEIIPEYSLSHYIDQGNKVFMGALSITEDGIKDKAAICESIRAARSESIKGSIVIQDGCNHGAVVFHRALLR
jgi:translation initiation factor 2B subunit (eIF-2B alpha/beta/delta family)